MSFIIFNRPGFFFFFPPRSRMQLFGFDWLFQTKLEKPFS